MGWKIMADYLQAFIGLPEFSSHIFFFCRLCALEGNSVDNVCLVITALSSSFHVFDVSAVLSNEKCELLKYVCCL